MNEDQPLPNSIEIEKTLLGTFLCSKQVLSDSIPSLPVEAFYSTHHREIYSAMCQMVSMSRVVDMVTITDELIHRGTYETVGGDEAIGELAEHIGAISNVPEYIRIVYQKYILRTAIEDCSRITKACYADGGRVEDLICKVENLTTKINSEAEKIQIENKKSGVVLRINDLKPEIYDYHKNGLNEKNLIYICPEWPIFSKNFHPCKKKVNVFTGIPTHGKSEFFDDFMIYMTINHGWKFGVYSPENFPIALWVQKLTEKIVKKSFFSTNRETLDGIIEFINAHFFPLEPEEENITVDAMLKLNLKAVKEYGVDACLWDPFNEIELRPNIGESLTDYIGRMLGKTRRHCRRHDYSMNIIAHPTKMLKDSKTGKYNVPTMYDINGGANWFNKADNGFCIYRNFDTGIIEVHRQKIKFKTHGHTGLSLYRYETVSGRYIELPEDNGFGTEQTKMEGM